MTETVDVGGGEEESESKTRRALTCGLLAAATRRLSLLLSLWFVSAAVASYRPLAFRSVPFPKLAEDTRASTCCPQSLESLPSAEKVVQRRRRRTSTQLSERTLEMREPVAG
jgi:hypothetical protein